MSVLINEWMDEKTILNQNKTLCYKMQNIRKPNIYSY